MMIKVNEDESFSVGQNETLGAPSMNSFHGRCFRGATAQIDMFSDGLPTDGRCRGGKC
ncbi:hypothetical protein VFPPC_17647 [Pochonia chlamydosporia 170]|uniref:Uncharacterized protein n=1 Tax=Pochonia chlamydosporia 170 TaxID=1380566 RepID=A0A219AQW4_METCM|nr:hypothetical protein VFPPC_17647 [Pochonia chlamydosporia 170]OWT43177.1 hypothetical protein VFPPC_17647 [Pochonia chlamydosporia 170]